MPRYGRIVIGLSKITFEDEISVSKSKPKIPVHVQNIFKK